MIDLASLASLSDEIRFSSACHETGHAFAGLAWGVPFTRAIARLHVAADGRVGLGAVEGVRRGEVDPLCAARFDLAGLASEDVLEGRPVKWVWLLGRDIPEADAWLCERSSDIASALHWHAQSAHAGDRAHLMSLYTEVRAMLARHRETLLAVARALLDAGELSRAEVVALVGAELDGERA